MENDLLCIGSIVAFSVWFWGRETTRMTEDEEREPSPWFSPPVLTVAGGVQSSELKTESRFPHGCQERHPWSVTVSPQSLLAQNTHAPTCSKLALRVLLTELTTHSFFQLHPPGFQRNNPSTDIRSPVSFAMKFSHLHPLAGPVLGC